MSGLDDYGVAPTDKGEAEPDTEAKIKAFPNPSLDECPVVPLGFDGASVLFAMPEGEIRSAPAAKINTAMLRTDIFACEAGASFLTYWRDSNEQFQAQMCATWFVRKCRLAGKWDKARGNRSLGVWPEGPGVVVLHKGDEIWRYEGAQVTRQSVAEALRAAAKSRGPLYKLHPPAPAPESAASVEDGEWVRDWLENWRWETLGGSDLTGADVTAAWLMASLMGAAAPFRVHLLLNALAGSGKTSLLTFVHALLSALSGEMVSNFTEAGFRNDISGMARPVIVDEAEASSGETGPGPVEQVLTLLRLMATGAGANRRMGAEGGGAIAQTAVGAVLMAAILPPKLDDALATRVAELRLLPLLTDGGNPDADPPDLADDAELESGLDHARKLAPRLLGRALEGAARYRADLAVIKAAFVEAGHDPRTADLPSALAAGRRLLLFDAPLAPSEGKGEVEFWAPLLAERAKAEAVSNPGVDALQHLLNWDSGQHYHDRRSTIGELITRTFSDSSDYADVLKAHGLRIYEGKGPDGRDGPWLLVANRHPALTKIYAKTRWTDWNRTLGYLDTVGPDHKTWATTPQRFGLSLSRATAIPLTPWLEDHIRVRVTRRNTERNGQADE